MIADQQVVEHRRQRVAVARDGGNLLLLAPQLWRQKLNVPITSGGTVPGTVILSQSIKRHAPVEGVEHHVVEGEVWIADATRRHALGDVGDLDGGGHASQEPPLVFGGHAVECFWET